MTYTLKELKLKTAVQLKEIAAGIDHEAVKGHTQMNKDHLIKAIGTALGIHVHEHHDVKGVDRSSLKSKIRTLKKEREKILEGEDRKQLKSIRHLIKEYRKKLRKAID